MDPITAVTLDDAVFSINRLEHESKLCRLTAPLAPNILDMERVRKTKRYIDKKWVVVATVEENQTIQLSSLHSVILMVVAGGSAVQPLEAEQKNQGKNQGQRHPVRGFLGSPSDASGSVLPRAFAFKLPTLSPFLALLVQSYTTFNLLVQNSG